jgi:hypothetical protein
MIHLSYFRALNTKVPLFTSILEEVFSETGDLKAASLALALSISKVCSEKGTFR